MKSSNFQNTSLGERSPRRPQAGPIHSLASLAIAVIVVAGLMVVLFPAQSDAHLVIDFGGSRRVFEGQVISGMTVLDALNASVVAGDIPLQFTIQDGQARIIEVDGYRKSQPVEVFLNGQQIDPSSIHFLPIRAQDEVVIKLIQNTE
ncbi:MAG: hypothetical protein AAB667_01235 [Patescibacteria group bacterium]